MAITHGGFAIPGTHEDLQLGPWTIALQRTMTFGNPGATQLTGERTTRTIVVPIWIYNSFASGAAVQTFLDTLDARQGTEGTLAETGNLTRSFENVSFDEFRQDRGPIPSTSLDWFVIGTLLFTQLKP